MSTHIILSLKQSSKDIRLIWFSVFIRMISFGLTNQVLTLYLKELGIRETKIGIFMSLTMIGDSVLSYILTWNANKIGNRLIMIIGSLLMLLSGAVFSSGTTNFSILLTAAIFGVISPSGNDTGPFKTIEETVLAHLTPPNHRPEIYAIHWVLGSIGSSLGSLFAGFLIQFQISHLELSYKIAYKNAFYFFTLISLLKLISFFFLSYKTEANYIPPYELETEENLNSHANESDNGENNETESSMTSSINSINSTNVEPNERRPLIKIQSTIEHQTITGLSAETQKVLFKLLLTFMLDSFGYGFMTPAWIVYYFKKKFIISSILLGSLFSISDILMSISAIPSAWFAKKFGPVKSSILTQIPSGIFFICIPIFSINFYPSSIFFLLNQMTTAFDVVPRQIILTSLINSNELPKVMGTVNIGKQIARSISPYFTGLLAENDYLYVCFFISAFFLILANILLALNFRNLDKTIKNIEQINHEII